MTTLTKVTGGASRAGFHATVAGFALLGLRRNSIPGHRGGPCRQVALQTC
jgi:hypothetical protein